MERRVMQIHPERRKLVIRIVFSGIPCKEDFPVEFMLKNERSFPAGNNLKIPKSPHTQ
jgi:hypothetical protein